MVEQILYTAGNGMMARSEEISIIANNLANLNTTGFKAEYANFSDLLYQTKIRPGETLNEAGNIIPTGIQIGLGTKLASTYKLLKQGDLKQTESRYDVAIQGTGYFRIENPDGTFSYTRDGSFRTNQNSEIVTLQGLVVSPGITIPNNTTTVTINSSGQVLANIAGTINPQIIGQLDIISFPNPNGLMALGDNLFNETQASGTPVIGIAGQEGMGEMLQGWLEASNVNPVTELTTMITAQRGYELCSKLVEAANEMLQIATRMKA